MYSTSARSSRGGYNNQRHQYGYQDANYREAPYFQNLPPFQQPIDFSNERSMKSIRSARYLDGTATQRVKFNQEHQNPKGEYRTTTQKKNTEKLSLRPKRNEMRGTNQGFDISWNNPYRNFAPQPNIDVYQLAALQQQVIRRQQNFINGNMNRHWGPPLMSRGGGRAVANPMFKGLSLIEVMEAENNYRSYAAMRYPTRGSINGSSQWRNNNYHRQSNYVAHQEPLRQPKHGLRGGRGRAAQRRYYEESRLTDPMKSDAVWNAKPMKATITKVGSYPEDEMDIYEEYVEEHQEHSDSVIDSNIEMVMVNKTRNNLQQRPEKKYCRSKIRVSRIKKLWSHCNSRWYPQGMQKSKMLEEDSSEESQSLGEQDSEAIVEENPQEELDSLADVPVPSEATFETSPAQAELNTEKNPQDELDPIDDVTSEASFETTPSEEELKTDDPISEKDLLEEFDPLYGVQISNTAAGLETLKPLSANCVLEDFDPLYGIPARPEALVEFVDVYSLKI